MSEPVFVHPNAVFTNDLVPRAAHKKRPDEFLPTLVEWGATIGANATIVCGTTIGAHAFVAAGAVVTRDVPPYALVAGNPARRLGWVCACGERLGPGLSCGCGRSYRRAGSEAAGLAPTAGAADLPPTSYGAAVSRGSRGALHAPG